MIIIKIKSKKQLREAPLLDLIDVSSTKTNFIGSRGSRAEPEYFKDTTTKLYQKTKQNLVIIIPSSKLIKMIDQEGSLPGQEGSLPGQEGSLPGRPRSKSETPQIIKKILNKKGINPNNVHVLLVATHAIAGDESEPIWTMVHDLIGHSLANQINDDIMYKKEIRTASEDKFDHYAIQFVRALYYGISPNFQTAGEVDEYDDSFVLFDIDSGDDRWADILAAIALGEYNPQEALTYLSETDIPPEDLVWLRKWLKNLINYLLLEVEKRTQWIPGKTSFMVSW